jgi:hypothetical protein
MNGKFRIRTYNVRKGYYVGQNEYEPPAIRYIHHSHNDEQCIAESSTKTTTPMKELVTAAAHVLSVIHTLSDALNYKVCNNQIENQTYTRDPTEK